MNVSLLSVSSSIQYGLFPYAPTTFPQDIGEYVKEFDVVSKNALKLIDEGDYYHAKQVVSELFSTCVLPYLQLSCYGINLSSGENVPSVFVMTTGFEEQRADPIFQIETVQQT